MKQSIYDFLLAMVLAGAASALVIVIAAIYMLCSTIAFDLGALLAEIWGIPTVIIGVILFAEFQYKRHKKRRNRFEHPV